MNEHAEKLIHILISKNDPVPSKELAEALHVSTRSIRNYVSEINRHEKIISSSRNGLSISKMKAKAFLQKEKPSSIPLTSKERGQDIIKQMFIYGHQLNLFDLSEQYFVSYSTIKNDIAHMNNDYRRFNVNFSVKHDLLIGNGEEKDIRQLVSYLLSQETKNQFSSLNILRSIFGKDYIDTIDAILNTMISNYNLIINDFSLMNIIMHIAIIINRISKADTLTSMSFNYKSEEEQMMIDMLIEKLEKAFSLHFSLTERDEIALLISSNTYQYVDHEINIHDDMYLLASRLMTEMTDTFHLEINHKNFLPLLSMHLKNLLVRCQNHKFVSNPMKETIKKISPVIYDMAVSMALGFTKYTHYALNDDEISFLAMHIGNALDMNEDAHKHIQTLLICPQYGAMQKNLKEAIMQAFPHDLQITQAVSPGENIQNFELILSVMPIEHVLEPEFLVISPFLNQTSLSLIAEKIKIIQKRRKNAWIHKRFDDFFGKDFFIYSELTNTPTAIIHALSSTMVQKQVVPTTFEESVLQRENACPTSFSHFAIPHATKMSANNTKVGVFISPQGITWQSQTVNIVLLLAVNEYDKSLFIDLYNTFIDLLSRDDVISKLLQCSDYDTFRKNILQLIDC